MASIKAKNRPTSLPRSSSGAESEGPVGGRKRQRDNDRSPSEILRARMRRGLERDGRRPDEEPEDIDDDY